MNWSGVMPAMTTAFDSNLAVDHTFMAQHAQWLLANGCSGLVMLGSLGEGATLDAAEKVAILKNTVKTVAGKAPVVAAISSLSTTHAVTLAKEAEQSGCSGLMVLPPYIYSTDWREMKQHVSAIIAATPLSCMLYNNPVAYTTDFLPEQIAELAQEHAEPGRSERIERRRPASRGHSRRARRSHRDSRRRGRCCRRGRRCGRERLDRRAGERLSRRISAALQPGACQRLRGRLPAIPLVSPASAHGYRAEIRPAHQVGSGRGWHWLCASAWTAAGTRRRRTDGGSRDPEDRASRPRRNWRSALLAICRRLVRPRSCACNFG